MSAPSRRKSFAHSSACSPGLMLALLGTAAFVALLASLVAMGLAPVVLVGLYALLSVLLFFTYGADKSAARRRRWRTPEMTLHLMALLGGWPGGLIAQNFYRHKTKKWSFQFVFWCTVVMNCAVLLWFVTQHPAASG